MLLMSPRKRIASIILGGPKPPFVQKMGESSETGEYEVPEEGNSDMAPAHFIAAAEEILAAIEKKDAGALAKALYSCLEMSEGE